MADRAEHGEGKGKEGKARGRKPILPTRADTIKKVRKVLDVIKEGDYNAKYKADNKDKAQATAPARTEPHRATQEKSLSLIQASRYSRHTAIMQALTGVCDRRATQKGKAKR